MVACISTVCFRNRNGSMAVAACFIGHRKGCGARTLEKSIYESNCNLHPKTAVSADEWIQKNKMAVATGDLEKPFSPDLGVVAANKKPWFLTTFTDEKIAELKESYDQYLLTDEPMLDEENPLLATWDQLGVRSSYVRPLLKYFNILNAKAREDEEMQVCF